MAPHWTLPELAAWRGRLLTSADGARVGEIEEVYYDFLSGRPVWIGVGGGGPLGVRTLLVPAGDHLGVDYPKSIIEDQPAADAGESFGSTSDARALYAYFGLPFDDAIDLRVLRRHDDLPGLERVVSEETNEP
jgi:hypothetical protein